MHCDNQAVIQMVNNMTSFCKNCMFLIHLLVLNNLKFNRRVSAMYINTKSNDLSDTLSRNQMQRFWKIAPDMCPQPTKIPEYIWCVQKICICLISFNFITGLSHQWKKRKASIKSKSSSCASVSSQISTKDITRIIEDLKHNQHRNSTKKNYYSVWKTFNEFFVRLDHKHTDWGDRLTLFVGHLITERCQSATMKSYISAIKAVLKMNNIKVTEDQFLLSSLIKACKLKNDQVKTCLSIQCGMLGLILKETHRYFNGRGQLYLACLYQTLFSTTYFGLLRVSEVTRDAHPILARDVHISANERKFLLLLRSSKTHGLGANPQMVKISAQSCNENKLIKKKCKRFHKGEENCKLFAISVCIVKEIFKAKRLSH